MQYDALKTEQQSLQRKHKGLRNKLDSMRKHSKAQDALMATNKKAQQQQHSAHAILCREYRGIKTQFEALKDERQTLQDK